MTKQRVMFYCQHVLGMGHFVRSAEIVRGLHDYEVCFLNGGEIVSGFELPPSVAVINLPPLRSDAEFRDIQTVDGANNLAAIKTERRRRLLAEYERFRPDVLMIELFPFGRRKFADELVPLLERIQADGRKTKVVCSLRDILVSKRDQARFDAQACELANRYFDLVLVHSDPAFQRLEETFPRAHDIQCPVRYTGFVAQRISNHAAVELKTDEDEKVIVVSIGGGRVGESLIECAIAASDLLAATQPHLMLIFTGPYLPEDQYQQFSARTAQRPRLRLARYTTNFTAYLKRADLSVSMAGYNTCMNILATGVRAIVCPFTGNNNEEQTIRAVKLQSLGALAVIHPSQLSPAQLAAMMNAELERTTTGTLVRLQLNGAEQTAAALKELLAQSATKAGEVAA